jgi:hypothetical protein
MGLLASCCPKSDAQKNERQNQGSKGGPRVQAVRNQTEDPHAPLLAKRPDHRPSPALTPEFDDFISGLSSDDGTVLDNDEVDAILNKAD